jgi:DNA-binding NarL/FixJ family response regulator
MNKILIVEDEKALRDAYVFLFKTQPYQVIEAANGKEALSLLAEERPDVILLDILMPVMSGLEFLEAANISKYYPDTKVLVLSNLSDEKTIDQIMELGASQYILKASASPKELLTAVQKL